jgi:hypothetical protein
MSSTPSRASASVNVDGAAVACRSLRAQFASNRLLPTNLSNTTKLQMQRSVFRSSVLLVPVRCGIDWFPLLSSVLFPFFGRIPSRKGRFASRNLTFSVVLHLFFAVFGVRRSLHGKPRHYTRYTTWRLRFIYRLWASKRFSKI